MDMSWNYSFHRTDEDSLGKVPLQKGIEKHDVRRYERPNSKYLPASASPKGPRSSL